MPRLRSAREDERGDPTLNPVQIRHVREALHQRFNEHIDMSDLDGRPESERTTAFRSRALAALALQIEAGISVEEAAGGVIDGFDDNGIDALALSQGDGNRPPRLWLVQSKWSENGRASISQGDALKFLRGLELMMNAEYEEFNERFKSLSDTVHEVLGMPSVQISLILALMGEPTISDAIRGDFDRDLSALNAAQPMVDLSKLGLKQFHAAAVGDAAESKLNLFARLDGWNAHKEPYKAFYGTMLASDVANLYEEHGRRLFTRNIRDSLDLTEVNVGITSTLVKDPEHFWYFNNGITVLADSITKSARFAGQKDAPGEFTLKGASVVNGAQTVAAIHRAFKQDANRPASGQVIVRLISLEDCPEGFDVQITERTNTQNKVETRDFAALDADQTRLRQDFAISLGKTYVIRRGEAEPTVADGCSIVEAATALACAHRNPEYAAKARRDESLLWERGTRKAIFGQTPNAFRTWRSVQLLRTVKAHLGEQARTLQGRASAVASYGDLLIAHIVYQGLDTARIDEPEFAWQAQLDRAPELISEALHRLIVAIDAEYGLTSHVIAACRNPDRSTPLVSAVLRDMTQGKTSPALPTAYLPETPSGRRRPAVHILVDAGVIPAGALLQYRPVTANETQSLRTWLEAVPERATASWTADRQTPLMWTVDSSRHSPTGLAQHLLKLATGAETARPVQGTTRWWWGDRGNLAQLAERQRQEEEQSLDETLDEG